jgi:predicted methyltransferase
MLQLSRSAAVWLSGSFVLIFGVGLLSGQLLQQWDSRRGFDQEAARIASELAIQPGMAVGDVHAGLGRWTVDLAERVGPSGHVFSTSGPNPPHELLQTIAASGVDNVSVINRTGASSQQELPAACCDAILLRLVYSYMRERQPDLAETLFTNAKPGARIAVINFEAGSPGFQGGGRGIARSVVIDDFTSAGFEMLHVCDSWPNNAFCIVFRRPGAPVTTS